MVGIAAAQTTRSPVVLAALAGLVAGALSMAAGEYVPVSSLSNTEMADWERERREQAEQPECGECGEYDTGRTPDDTRAVSVWLWQAGGAHHRGRCGA